MRIRLNLSTELWVRGSTRQEENRHMGRNFFSSARGKDLQLICISSSVAASWVTEMGLIPGHGTFVHQARNCGLISGCR